MSMNPTGPDVLDAALNIRLSTAEKQKRAEEARFAGISLSELARARLNGQQIVAAVDIEMIGALRKATGLLKHVHVESKGAYSKATAEAIADLKALAESIMNQKRDSE